MRLIDLLRDREGQTQPVSKFQSKYGRSLSLAETPKSVTKKSEPKAVFLQAGDLTALYDITAPAGDLKTETLTGYDSDRHPRTEISEEKIDIIEDNSKAKKPIKSAFAEQAGIEVPDNFRTIKGEEEKAGSIIRNMQSESEMVSDDNRDEIEIADTIHIELLSILDDIFTEGKEGVKISVERLIDPMTRLIEVCKTSNAILRKAVRLKSVGGTFTAHSLNAAIIAIKIGLNRGYSDEKVFSLGLCALLGDIGMTCVESSILNKSEKLTTDEFHRIKKHVDYSVEIVSKISNKFPFLAHIVSQIHERENGNGYPHGLKGENIHEFAKIIGMCDVYVALTEPKVNREKYSGYVALQQIISHRGIDFDPKIIKSLIDVISVFPLESLVKLNNGAVGRIMDISPVHPTRPKLNVLVNSDGEKLTRPRFLDLENEPLLYIEDPDIEEGTVQ